MTNKKSVEYTTIRKQGKLITAAMKPDGTFLHEVPRIETPLQFAKRKNAERRAEIEEEGGIQYASQGGGGPIWTNPVGECWKDQNEMQGEMDDLLAEARNYPAPAMLTCNHLTYSTPLGTQIYILDPICEQAARIAWYNCKTAAMIDLQTALQKAYNTYYDGPERKAADLELEEDNSQVEERCERIYQATLLAAGLPLDSATILAAKIAYMACIGIGYRQARAEWCSAWNQGMDDWQEGQFIGAMTGFYNDMLICDNTYRNSNCCVAIDN